MKILNFFFVKLVIRLHKNKSTDNKETALWGILALFDGFIALFILYPLMHLFNDLGIFKEFSLWSSREQATALVIPLFIQNLFYFFWDTRWLKLYREVQEWPITKIERQRNICLAVFIGLTVLSIIYSYFNFSFGRW